jgi:hypothetical protein
MRILLGLILSGCLVVALGACGKEAPAGSGTGSQEPAKAGGEHPAPEKDAGSKGQVPKDHPGH